MPHAQGGEDGTVGKGRESRAGNPLHDLRQQNVSPVPVTLGFTRPEPKMLLGQQESQGVVETDLVVGGSSSQHQQAVDVLDAGGVV